MRQGNDLLLPGFSGGLDVTRVWALATSQLNNSVIGGAVIFASGIIGALGLIACCIGVFFTITYAALAAAADEAAANPADVISFRVELVSTGSLSKNGRPAVPGTTAGRGH